MQGWKPWFMNFQCFLYNWSYGFWPMKRGDWMASATVTINKERQSHDLKQFIPLAGGFTHFWFSPRNFGKMNPFWRAYFSDGLVKNHQPVIIIPNIRYIIQPAKRKSPRNWKVRCLKLHGEELSLSDRPLIYIPLLLLLQPFGQCFCCSSVFDGKFWANLDSPCEGLNFSLDL